MRPGDEPMASIYKRKRDLKRKNSSWYIAYTDHTGKRQTVKGCPDKAATEAMARKLESEAELRRRGVIDARDDAYAAHESRHLAEHLDHWRDCLLAKGCSERHA